MLFEDGPCVAGRRSGGRLDGRLPDRPGAMRAIDSAAPGVLETASFTAPASSRPAASSRPQLLPGTRRFILA